MKSLLSESGTAVVRSSFAHGGELMKAAEDAGLVVSELVV